MANRSDGSVGASASVVPSMRDASAFMKLPRVLTRGFRLHAKAVCHRRVFACRGLSGTRMLNTDWLVQEIVYNVGVIGQNELILVISDKVIPFVKFRFVFVDYFLESRVHCLQELLSVEGWQRYAIESYHQTTFPGM